MIVPNFSISQSLGTPTTITITDTSTGVDAGLTGRLIYFRKYDGNYLVPTDYTTTYVFWPIASTSLIITDIMDKDYCLDVTVYWYTGSTATYSKTILTLFTNYSEIFLRGLTRAQASDPNKINSSNWWYNKLKLRTLLDDASQAVTELNDQTVAQYCLDKAYDLYHNPQVFF